MTATLKQINFAALTSNPAKGAMNGGLTSPRNASMLNLFGAPSNVMHEGAPITNAKLRALVATQDVGPFRCTGIKPALASLTNIFAQVKEADPRLYDEVKTAGMMNVRPMRGSSHLWSNHSFGTAIDLYFGSGVTPFGSSKTYLGILKLYPYFHNNNGEPGWYWGAEFPTPDSMHFEASLELLQKWDAAGLI